MHYYYRYKTEKVDERKFKKNCLKNNKKKVAVLLLFRVTQLPFRKL